ncbi:Site-specific DNA-cytosine methylase (plasmid) [Nostoc flagelliforme CCNUN1]|uniref:Site-specific DNA-cytosine methylase n=2 Tax=Nostoc flagelliforme TaxID=1306274 RepID=A0A2K8TAR3_9NOSO|nr:Site-specific DNA-cytosine methylase [Nostoc flagelliforme CCNUN1]
MTKLEPQEQQEVWLTAVELVGGKVPTGRIVKDVVQKIMERSKLPNTYQWGEVCQILAKDNPELRGKGGCWGIVARVNDFSCTVKTWDGEYAVGLQHLKFYNYLSAVCEQMREICDRINRLRENENLEEAARAVLKHLGELKQPYLTGVEEKLLMLLESEYGVRIIL